MTRDQFWDIIERVKDTDRPEIAIKSIFRQLAKAELESYQSHFDTLIEETYRWDLWGAAYVIESGCSDDGFLDFRYGLIALGREVWESAIENPDSLADVKSNRAIANEAFGYVALEVLEEPTGGEKIPRKPPGENTLEPTGEMWDFENREKTATRLPKLSAKWGPF